MQFTFKTRKGNYYTISLTIFILPVIVLIIAAVVVIWAAVEQSHYESAYEKTYEAIICRRDSITVENRSADRNAVIRCAFSTPELFTVDHLQYRETSGGVQYRFIYNAYTDDYENDLKEYHGYINAIVSSEPEFEDDRAAVKWIHDYIIEHYEYGGDHSAFSMLKTGRGVCSAYTALFTALAEEAGLEHGVARSEAMDHAWNMVKLDGEWYHVDVTWDDLGDNAGYEYYLKTSSEFLTLNHHDWIDTGVSLATYENTKTNLLKISLLLFIVSITVTFLPFLKAYFTK